MITTMDKQDKEILLKNLCARLPYGVKCEIRQREGRTNKLREVLSAHMHGGEIDEVLAELDEKMKGK